MIRSFCLLFIFLCSSWSCTKQKSPALTGEIRGAQEEQRLEACTNVNFNKGILTYRNTLLLFQCTKWDQKFAHLYEAILKTSETSWDKIFSPINEGLLDNVERKNKIFKNIRELDLVHGLDDLSYVLESLMETNFYDSVKNLFSCIDNPAELFCQGRDVPSRNSIKKILHVIETDPVLVSDSISILKAIKDSIGIDKENLRNEINQVKNLDLLKKSRQDLLNALAMKIKIGMDDHDRSFIPGLLRVGNTETNIPWIYQWLTDKNLGPEKFKNLLIYPAITNTRALDDIKAIKYYYNNGMTCHFEKEGKLNDQLAFDLTSNVNDFVDVLKNKDRKGYYDFNSMLVVGVKTATPICRELVSNEYQLNLIRVAEKIADFFQEKSYFQLMKFIMNHSYVNKSDNLKFEESIYFGDFLTGDIFASLNNLNKTLGENSKNIFPVVYNILLRLPPENILKLENILTQMNQASNDEKLKGLVDFWLFLNGNEKNFLFNFIDRHFDRDVQYLALLDFYIKFMEDFRDTQDIFKSHWTGSEVKDEEMYLAIQDLFNHLSGKETLDDFKLFFSRDQILKVLEVLSSGQSIVNAAKSELSYRDSSDYLANVKQSSYKIKVNYRPGTIDNYEGAALLVECMKKFEEVQNGFYFLIKNLPTACQKVTSENISFRLFGWMNFIDQSFSAYKIATDSVGESSLFDSVGVLSPSMLTATLSFSKTVDNLIGVQSLFDSFNKYLNSKNGISILEKDTWLFERFLQVDSGDNVRFRNSMLKSFTNEDNFKYANTIVKNTSDLILDYGEYIKSGKYAQSMRRDLGKMDERFSCKNQINQEVAPHPCPDKDTVKVIGNDLIQILRTIWQEEQGSSARQLLYALKEKEGLNIPLNARKTHKYRVTLEEALKFLYNTTDRSMSVNNQSFRYENDYGQVLHPSATVLERIESVIREVRFGENYLGALYLNHVVSGSDYNADVIERRRLLSACVNIPLIRCGKYMSDSDLRMSKNAVATFDGLTDANNGNGLEARLHYGEFLKTVEQVFVASSTRDAQEATFLPLSADLLRMHNGKALVDLAMLNVFSNSARFVRDRVGRTREEFEAFIKREDFKRVDRAFLHGLELQSSSSSLERLLAKLQEIPKGETQSLFALSVDWIAGLSYEDSRLLEDTAARIFALASYLGRPDLVFEAKEYNEIYNKYQNNNLYLMFLALEKMIDIWPNLKNYFPNDTKLINVIRPINNFLYFLTEKLNNEGPRLEDRKTYRALNDLFYVFQSVLLEKVDDATLALDGRECLSRKSFYGIDFLIAGMKNPELVNQSYVTIRENYKFLDAFYENDGQFFISLGTNLSLLSKSEKVDMTALKDYLRFTSKNAICTSGDIICQNNFHYDELATLVTFLNQKNSTGETHLNELNKKLFKENFEQITELITQLLRAVQIKK